MGRAMQCLLIILMSSAQLVLSSPLTEGPMFYIYNGRRCRECPAGQFQKSCEECSPCPDGSYTAEVNREDSCHLCFRDCTAGFHLKVVRNCTSESDLECVCEDGYRCTGWVTHSNNCRSCKKIQEINMTASGIIGEDKNRLSSASSGQSRVSAKPCRLPDCGPQSGVPAGNGTLHKTGETSSHLAAILCPVIGMGCFALIVLLFNRGSGNESCFKQSIAMLCKEGGRDASHKLKESNHQFPRDSFSAKQQPSSLAAANLGSVHVHNPGTVIFSLLSQFTGQVGPTVEPVKTGEGVKTAEEDEEERDCPVSSPGIPLSQEEEERSNSAEMDSIFFPSQEQGKDCHVSKEEVL